MPRTIISLNDEERMLRDTARQFCVNRAPVSQLRELRDTADIRGFKSSVWSEMADMAWTAVPWPEAVGGIELGYKALGVITEETGKTLVASPLLATVWLGGTLVNLSGSALQKSDLLAKISTGSLLLAVALDENFHHSRLPIITQAVEVDGGWEISGHKTMVLDGHVADHIIVLARTSGAPEDRGGLSLFMVDGEAAGLSRRRIELVDSRAIAEINFDRVRVGQDALLGGFGEGWLAVESMLNVAVAGLSAEMLGTAQECFDRSVAYMKQRIQFGVPIGSFQALKHRAAKLYCDIELARSTVYAALVAIDNSAADVSRWSSAAKAKVSQVLHDVSREAIQFHGGYGMTDECEIGFFLKRAAVSEQLLGDARFHRKRFASDTSNFSQANTEMGMVA